MIVGPFCGQCGRPYAVFDVPPVLSEPRPDAPPTAFDRFVKVACVIFLLGGC